MDWLLFLKRTEQKTQAQARTGRFIDISIEGLQLAF